MKTVFYALVALFSTTAVMAQQVSTTMVTLKDLITHAADAYPAADANQILILFESQENGLTSDQRFYTEQGINLLLNRLGEDDTVAFATYGSENKVILPYTAIQNKEHILKVLQDHMTKVSKNDGADGIDIAYQFAQDQFSEDVDNKVLMIRNGETTKQRSSEIDLAQAKLTSESEKAKLSAKSPVAQQKLGGAIALTALSILPEVLKVLKN